MEVERMAADDAAEGTVQDELAAFIASLGVTAVRTDQTYDALVRASQETSG
jgi:hypothetical protein